MNKSGGLQQCEPGVVEDGGGVGEEPGTLAAVDQPVIEGRYVATWA
jgi:hypothetical protein